MGLLIIVLSQHNDRNNNTILAPHEFWIYKVLSVHGMVEATIATQSIYPHHH